MKKYQDIAGIFLRLTLAGGFLSAVASRLSMWGSHSSGWIKFLAYTAEVNSFAPKSLVPFLAIMSTIAETAIAVLLLIGYKTRWAALSASILTLLFGSAMSFSFGIKDPLDYSVFVVCAAALLLATIPGYRWSIDQGLEDNRQVKILSE